MLRRILKRRILFAALLASLLLGLSFSPAFEPTSARPCNSILKDYYSDATYTDLVGEYYWPCVGQPSHWGVTSDYVDVSLESCGGACGQ